jgi:transposase-like protein
MTEMEIYLTLRFRVPEKGLTVNGILQGLEEQTPTVLRAILEQIFRALEEEATMRLHRENPGRYIHNGHQRNPRKLITHFGPFHYRMAQMIDSQTGKTFNLLAQELNLMPYRQYQAEALEASIGLAIHLSYAQASKEVIRIRGSGPSKSTIHRRLREISRAYGVWPEMKKIPYRFLMVDGTKVHLQGPGGIDLEKKEMRWALASLGPGHKFEPVGFWIGNEWAEIRKDLEKRLNYEKFEVLFSDGGPGIAENLLARGMRQQRCLWHGKRDFPFMLYADKIKKAEQEPFRSLFDRILIFSLSQEQLEKIDPDDFQKIRDLVENTRQGFEQLFEVLDQNKYPKARTYLKNLYRHTMTFLDYWMKNQSWIPLNINAIESAFSRITNRIKHVGKRWSDQGLLEWLMLAFRKIYKPELWNQLWDQYLEINRKLELVLYHAEHTWLQ